MIDPRSKLFFTRPVGSGRFKLDRLGFAELLQAPYTVLGIGVPAPEWRWDRKTTLPAARCPRPARAGGPVLYRSRAFW